MARDIDLIWVQREGKYFCKQDWTAGIGLIGFNNSSRARKALARHNLIEPVCPRTQFTSPRWGEVDLRSKIAPPLPLQIDPISSCATAPATAAAAPMKILVRAAAEPGLAVAVQVAAARKARRLAAPSEPLRLAWADMSAPACALAGWPAAAEALRSGAARSARKNFVAGSP